MVEEEEAEEIARALHLTWWGELRELVIVNGQSAWWGVEHWALTHLFRLRFCHACSAYHRAISMASEDTCALCASQGFH